MFAIMTEPPKVDRDPMLTLSAVADNSAPHMASA
jgi:hypothetical protein